MQQRLCEQFSLQLLSTEGLALNTLSTDFTETLLESSSNATVHSQGCESSRAMRTQKHSIEVFTEIL